MATDGGVIFSTKRNFAIFLPNLAILSRYYALFDKLFTRGGVPNLTNKRYESMMSVVMRVR